MLRAYSVDITWSLFSPCVVHFIHLYILAVCYTLFFQINPDCPSTNCSIHETFIHECFKWSKNLTYSNVLSMQFYNFLPCDFSCPNKTQPVECSAGSYAATGSFKCHLCPKGAFCPTKGLSTFHLCVNGTYSNIEGLSDCKVCDAGFRCPRVGMEAPEECPNGTYSYSVGARYCVLCPEGHRWGYNLIINSTVHIGHPIVHPGTISLIDITHWLLHKHFTYIVWLS